MKQQQMLYYVFSFQYLITQCKFKDTINEWYLILIVDSLVKIQI